MSRPIITGLSTVDIEEDAFEIIDLKYVRMPRQPAVYSRPYKIIGKREAFEDLNEQILRNGAKMSNRSKLASSVGQIIRPSERAFETVANERWMEETKFVFYLKVKSYDIYNDERYTYLIGYTNHADTFTSDRSSDINMYDDMEHTITAVYETMLKKDRKGRPIGGEVLLPSYELMSDFGGVVTYSQRPMDMASDISRHECIRDSGALDDDSPYDIEDHDFSKRNPLATLGGTSNRAEPNRSLNNSGTHYFTSILNEGVTASRERELNYDYDEDVYEGIDDHLSPSIEEPNILDNDFLSHLNAVNNYNNFRGVFSYGQLLDIDPEGAHDFELIEVDYSSRNNVLANTPFAGSEWYGQDAETVIAFSMLESSIAIALNCGFTKVRYVIDGLRHPYIDEDLMEISPPTACVMPLDSFNFDIIVSKLKREIIGSVYLAETQGGRMPLYAEVIVDIFGVSKIGLGIDTDDIEWFTFPTVANAFMSPAFSQDSDIVETNRGLFSTTIDTILSITGK